MNFIALSCSHALGVSFPLFLSIARFSLLPFLSPSPRWLAHSVLSLSLLVVHTRVNAGTHAAADRCNAASGLWMWKCGAPQLQIAGTGRRTDLLMARNQGAGRGDPGSGEEDWEWFEVVRWCQNQYSQWLPVFLFCVPRRDEYLLVCPTWYPSVCVITRQPWDRAGWLSGLEACRVTLQRLN